jgi:hypothetical protein
MWALGLFIHSSIWATNSGVDLISIDEDYAQSEGGVTWGYTAEAVGVDCDFGCGAEALSLMGGCGSINLFVGRSALWILGRL